LPLVRPTLISSPAESKGGRIATNILNTEISLNELNETLAPFNYMFGYITDFGV
jgi:hypothetical protein